MDNKKSAPIGALLSVYIFNLFFLKKILNSKFRIPNSEFFNVRVRRA
jgi:hypothetical protein